MATFPVHQTAFAFGLLGNIVSFMVFLAPVPTFYRIFKKKSTEGFQSIPYSVALFSAMLMLYYAFVKTNALFLITINSFGCIIESIYLVMYIVYATEGAKIYTTKLLFLFNFAAFGLIVLVTFFIWEGPQRVSIVGWICAIFSLCVFAAPLSIMRRVIKTKSVEYMPFSLSFFLTLCAVMWFFYGLLLKDFYIATPNILGFAFGIAQMILYAIYKDGKKNILPETKLKELENNTENYKVDIQAKSIMIDLDKAEEAAKKGGIQEITDQKDEQKATKQVDIPNGTKVSLVDIPEEVVNDGAEKASMKTSESIVLGCK